MQLSLFDIPQSKIELEEIPALRCIEPVEMSIVEVFQAYFACRKNKRYTLNALAFEIDYENNLVQLCEEINSGTYKIGRSIAFIVDKPVKREIFAADFRDRVVHHLIIGKLNHLFENNLLTIVTVAVLAKEHILAFSVSINSYANVLQTTQKIAAS